ncbi:MAG: tetraacyldisaccharide 4'-kinase [Candidatus Neomarinimicrobiota bacterium]
MSVKLHQTDSAFRFILFPLALFYWGVLFWRNLFYNIGFFVSNRLPCKVISIGNLTTGGTGKTPAVIFFAKWIRDKGYKVAVLSRGYGRSSTGTQLVTDGKTHPEPWRKYGDEPVLMYQALNGVPIVVDENRYRGGLFLIHKFNPDFIILDDGFQHRSLKRDLDIVLINSLDTRADHKLLPYGLLREPWIHMRRASLIFFTKTNYKKPSTYLRSKSRGIKKPCYTSIIKSAQILRGPKAKTLEISSVHGENVLALSAIADPESFLKTIEESGFKILKSLTYVDHYIYTQEDIGLLRKKYEAARAGLIITTEKDLVKLHDLDLGDLPVYALPIEFYPHPKSLKALEKMI